MKSTDKAAVMDSRTVASKEWFTQAELDELRPVYFYLNQTAITSEGSFTYCGFNKWFRISGN